MGRNKWFIPYMPGEEYKDSDGVVKKNELYLNGNHYPTRESDWNIASASILN